MLTNLRNTPFLYACSHKSYKVVKYMINDSKTQVNHFNCNYETPLHKDCSCQSLKIRKILINDPRVDINIMDKNKNTPFSSSLFT